MRRMAAAVVTLAGLGACSSTGGGGTTSAPVPVSVVTQSTTGASMGGGLSIVNTTQGQTVAIAGSREAVWTRVVAAYDALGLPIAYKDDAKYVVGNDQIKARRAIRAVQMRDAVDCGSDLNGDKAETYEIRLSISSTVAAAADGTAELTTTVSGVGRSPSFGGNSDVNCPTKGAFERAIAKYVKRELGLGDR
jgi:hypothetical protein